MKNSVNHDLGNNYPITGSEIEPSRFHVLNLMTLTQRGYSSNMVF